MLYFSAERLIRNNIKKGIVMELHNSQKATNYIYIQNTHEVEVPEACLHSESKFM